MYATGLQIYDEITSFFTVIIRINISHKPRGVKLKMNNSSLNNYFIRLTKLPARWTLHKPVTIWKWNDIWHKRFTANKE